MSIGTVSAPAKPNARGYIRHPQKDQQIADSHRRHGAKLRQIAVPTAPDFTWLALGKLTPVLDQMQCGSCWDFAGCECASLALVVAGQWPADGSMMFSPQYVLDCMNTGGCNGDDSTTVLAEAKANGLPTTADYGPYVGGPQQCNTNGAAHKTKIADWGFADGSGGNGVTPVAAIKAALVTYGPLSVSVDASAFDSYTSGIMRGTGHNIDHQIICYGWHDDATMPEGGYWLCQNQWGTSWGEQGRLRIAYGAYDIGTETQFAVASTGPTPPPPPPPPPPGPPPPPVPVPTVSTVALQGTDGVRNVSLSGTITSPPAAGQTAMPAWLLLLLQVACQLAPQLPPPWSSIIAAFCTKAVPAMGKGCGCQDK